MSTDAELAAADHDYSASVGRTECRCDLLLKDRVEAMAATLGLDAVPDEGRTLPPGWHWLFFNPFVNRTQLSQDGHPRRGSFLPDVTLPRRMWAGGRLRYHSALPVGVSAERKSEIVSVKTKRGRSGVLVFVTICHSIRHNGTLFVEEEQDIVYRESPATNAPAPQPQPAPEEANWSHEVTPDPVLLFRYSALTSNGHRIHYDWPYARQEEGYPDLVVHGPLIATLLQGFAQHIRPQDQLTEFEFRATAPLFVSGTFRIEGKTVESGDGLDLWARGPKGELAMRASAGFRPRLEL